MNGVVEIQTDKNAVVEAVNYFLERPELSQKISQAGFDVLKENQGALARTLKLLARYL